jgi:glutamate/tyrosine decarboxylase-like PLP-dependent enzyme
MGRRPYARPVHRFDDDARLVMTLAQRFVADRLAAGAALGATATPDALATELGETITERGLGVAEAFRRFDTVVAPATIGLDSPRFLAFIPAAPTAASALFDAVVSASSFSGESWLEAAGAVHAENEVLRFLAGLAGLPETAGGCFVSGGSAGNLNALAVARDTAGARVTGERWVAVADTTHSSVANALALLGLRALVVPTAADGVFTADALRAAIAGHPQLVCAVVASAGSTNAGVIDDLSGLADVCAAHGAWLHVDGAYGLAALLSPTVRPAFAGVEAADSLIVDPHKWLFGPLDCCALLYRDPHAARAIHTQDAPYLDALHVDGAWNPADFAFHLTRRTRGLPVWFSLAAYGVSAYRRAVEAGLGLARWTADRLRSLGRPVELVMDPTLSVVLFRRHGWSEADWYAWSRALLHDGVAFVTPTRWKGETLGRLVFLHPETGTDVIEEILARLVRPPAVS